MRPTMMPTATETLGVLSVTIMHHSEAQVVLCGRRAGWGSGCGWLVGKVEGLKLPKRRGARCGAWRVQWGEQRYKTVPWEGGRLLIQVVLHISLRCCAKVLNHKS